MRKLPPARELQKLHESLYKRAHAEASALGARPTGRLRDYAKEFERSLPRSFTRTEASHLIDSVLRRRIVLFGDFHTFKQTQRALLRLLRDVLAKSPRPKLVLAIEFLKSKYQGKLESYMAGEIAEDEFLQAVNYGREWGFPWAHYKPLIELARDHMIPVICVNSNHPGPKSLEMRDKTCARFLADAAQRYPDHIVFCMIGEYHLADSHLPATLWNELARRGIEASTPLMRVVCNVDRYYFDLENSAKPARSTEVLRLKRDFYCILNSAPWLKWHSFAIWEEMRTGFPGAVENEQSTLDQDDDHADDDSFDVDFQFQTLTQTLATFLGLDIPKKEVARFHSQFSPAAEFSVNGLRKAGYRKVEVTHMVERAALEGYYFDCRSRTLLLTAVSINNLAEAAGQFLLALATDFSEGGSCIYEEFANNSIKHAAGIVGSKILNPRRKTKDYAFHTNYLEQTKRRRLSGYARIRRQVSRSVCDLLVSFDRFIAAAKYGKGSRLVNSVLRVESLSQGEASAEFGRMVGAALYSGVMRNRIPATWIRNLFMPLSASSISSVSVLMEYVHIAMSIVTRSQPSEIKSGENSLIARDFFKAS